MCLSLMISTRTVLREKGSSDCPSNQSLCASLAPQHGNMSGYLCWFPPWPTAYVSKQLSFWQDRADAQAPLNLCYSHMLTITKTCYIILTPLNPTFIQYNSGLKGYILFVLFLLKNIDCRYSLEPSRRVPAIYVLCRKMKKKKKKYIRFFLSENFHYLVVKCSLHLNRHVFIMGSCFLTRLK